MNDRRGAGGRVPRIGPVRHPAVVFTRFNESLQFAGPTNLMNFVLATPQAGIPPADLAEAISAQTGLMALTSDQFLWKTVNYMLGSTGIPVNFGITMVLGLLSAWRSPDRPFTCSRWKT